MDRDNYNVYQLQLPQVSVWILQTAEDVAEAFRVVQEDKEHTYRTDDRSGSNSKPYFPPLNWREHKYKLQPETSSVSYEEWKSEYANSFSSREAYVFGLNSAIIASSNGQALITGRILPSDWPEFLTRPVIRPVP